MVNQCPFWTEKLVAAVQTVESFPAVAEIALRVLKRMPTPVSQLCGPISTGGLGCRIQNERLFARCVAKLRAEGLNPFNQMPLQIGFNRLVTEWQQTNGGGYCWPIMEEVYRPIFVSGFVKTTFFLPGWETSTGTRWEREAVESLGIEAYEFDRDWYSQIIEELTGAVD